MNTTAHLLAVLHVRVELGQFGQEALALADRSAESELGLVDYLGLCVEE